MSLNLLEDLQPPLESDPATVIALFHSHYVTSSGELDIDIISIPVNILFLEYTKNFFYVKT